MARLAPGTDELLSRIKHDKRMDRLREMTTEEMAHDGCVSLPVACEFLSVGMTSLYKLMN